MAASGGTSSSFDAGSSIAPNRGRGHTIFLSHSGTDKNFTSILAKQLAMRSYEPFFDKVSLPIGYRTNMNGILEMAKTCKLGVIVLSDEFFSKTKNPMLELATFVKYGIPILPLFFKLTVDDVKNQGKRAKWIDKWNDWSCTEPDSRIIISDWVTALNKLTEITGPEYPCVASSSNANEVNLEEHYARLIADKICGLLPPDICPSDKHVQGKHRLCKEVEGMFARAHEVHGAKVLALWGMEGVGKSTLCNTLQRVYHAKFAGRVCYVEFARQQNKGTNSLLLEDIKTVCLKLTNANSDYVDTHITNVRQGIAYLNRHLPSSEKFLLILDNVHEYSVDEAKKFIVDVTSYPPGSHLLFLGRNRNALKRTVRCDTMIQRFPPLCFEEAEMIFLNQTLFLYQNESEVEQHRKDYNAKPEMQAIFKQCINLCRVSRAAGCGSSSDSYNPQMLESLASFLPGCKTQDYLSKWGKKLSDLEKDRNDAMKEMFRLLQESYDALNPHEKDLFLDLALYTLAGKDVKKLCFELEEAHVNKCLQTLTSISFLSEDYGVQDVHRDFARDLVNQSGELFYVQGKNFESFSSIRRILSIKEVLQKKIIKMGFVECTFSRLRGDRLDLKDEGICDIRVLLLDSVEGVASLNVGRNRLHRMEIKSTCALQVEVASTISLTVCTQVDEVSQNSGLPLIDFTELVILELQGRGKKPWKVDAAGLQKADSLKYVELDNIELTNSEVLELSGWPCLQELKLSNLASVLSGLQNLRTLKKLVLIACNQLSELQLPGELTYWCITKCEGLIKIEVLGKEEMNIIRSTDAEIFVLEKESRCLVRDCINLREIIAPKELWEQPA